MRTNAQKHILAIMGALLITACAGLGPLSEYTPVVDLRGTNLAMFESNLAECRNIGLKVEADYKKRRREEAISKFVTGLIAGAVVGAVAGDNTGQQSIYALGGAGAGLKIAEKSIDITYNMVKYGPRRVIDRCMNERGHRVLNDIGRG